MAFSDALFQLGMDLTRSSTAQKEDLGEVLRAKRATIPAEGRKLFGGDRGRERSPGDHLTIDLHGALRLDDVDFIEQALRRSVTVAGIEPLHIHLHRIAPRGGVAGVVVVGDCHVSVRSWPETGYLALDVLNHDQQRLRLSVETLKSAFMAHDVVVKSHRRGERRPSGKVASEHSATVRPAKAAPARVRRAA